MVLFTPITTLILEGVKLSELLSPTPRGRTTWAVRGWVDEEVVVEEMAVLLEVWDVVDEEEVVVEEEDADALELVDALDSVGEEVEVTVCVPECSVVVDEDWKRMLAVKAPATRTSVRPAMSTTIPSRPTRR